MRRRTSIAIWALSLIVPYLIGCPYSSKVPLGEPDPGLKDSKLIGSWLAIDLHGGDSSAVEVLPFNRDEYLIEVREPAGPLSNTKDLSCYRAFLIPVAEETMLQISEITEAESPNDFVLARYRFSGSDEMEVHFVGEKIVPRSYQTDADSLRRFLATHLADPDLNDEDTTLRLLRTK